MNIDNLKFQVHNNRRNSILNYKISKTPEGWGFKHISINGDCKPDGSPYFKMNFEQDNMSYPSSFGEFLEHLWSKIDSAEITEEEAQNKLQELADWVSLCEKNEQSGTGGIAEKITLWQ